jgi:hypothetical protein
MNVKRAVITTVALLSSLLAVAPSQAFDPHDPSLDPEKGTLSGSPVDDLPAYIEQVLPTGMRPTWSPDGRYLLYLDAPLGDVWRLDLRTGTRRNLTGDLQTYGFTRAHYLPNGDLVLCGPAEAPTSGGAEEGRFEGVLWALAKPYNGRVVPLGRPCWEGIAVSRTQNRIAWNESDIDFTSPQGIAGAAIGKSEIWMADVVRDGGRLKLVNVQRVVTRWESQPDAPIEVQDFRGPGDRELVFTAYAHLNGEVMGYDVPTGTTTNYSNRPFYEEAEGVAPDGSFVMVERDLMTTPIPGALDIWRLPLDGGLGSWQRVTHFNRYAGYGASNPVVSPDGKRIAFQLSLADGAEGEGSGLFVLDLTRVPDAPAPL